MMRFLTLEEVLQIHQSVIEQTGGAHGVVGLGLLESALGQCRTSFEGQDLYPSLAEKAAALCFSIVQNHPFVDGNKRTGHAAMEVFLVLNNHELLVGTDEAEKAVLHLASGQMKRGQFTRWIRDHIKPL
ncbi:MAG: type II toxin-antitoxin system death-on-curing family toxin [Thermodesulfobacteriota bacterium]